MKLSKMQEYVFKTKIELPCMEDEDVDVESKDYIILRELNMQEMNGIDTRDTPEADMKNMQHLQNIFPDCLVEHTFTKNDSDELLAKKEVYNNLKKSGTLFQEIILTWLTSLPFSKRLNKEK